VPGVAVVIPVYNPGPYLSEALESLTSQTYGDWEAVVVDDGSDWDVSFVSHIDPRIRLVRQANAGVSAARNTGIVDTSAPLIAFLDQDDVWLPTKLERQVAVMSMRSDSVLCSTDFEIIDGDGKRLRRGFDGGHACYMDLLITCAICSSTVMVRRVALERIGMFDTRYSFAPDWDLWLRLARNSPLARAEEVLARYRVHGSNFSRSHPQLLLSEGTAILRAHEQSASEIKDAAREGRRRLRQLVGAQEFDIFRETRQLNSLWVGLRMSPRLTLSQLGRYLRKRIM
jgi:glycosyltransferase involved in cell wall biosynthesis